MPKVMDEGDFDGGRPHHDRTNHDVFYVDDASNGAETESHAQRVSRTPGEPEMDADDTHARLSHAIQLTESALVEVSLAGLDPNLINAYVGVISALRALRDGTARSSPIARIADYRVAPARVGAPGSSKAMHYRLTRRQKAVVELLLTGAPTRKIAAALGLAEGTVKIHLTGIYRALGVNSRAEVIALLK
jgi:DNA-binding NarL/FixJ family response regulator